MMTKHYKAIQEILNGLSIQEAAAKNDILPDTLIKFLTNNFEIGSNKEVRDSKLFSSWASHKKIQQIDKKVSSAINNMKLFYRCVLEKCDNEPEHKVVHAMQVASHLGEKVASEISSLLVLKLKLKSKAEFYETTFLGGRA